MPDVEPLAARRGLHWHYAWVVVGASLLVEFFGIGFGFFALVASYPYFEQLGWARTTVVLSSSIMIVTIAVLSPLTGVYMDRRSIRSLFVAGGLVMAVGHALLGFAVTPAQFFFGAAVLGLGMSGVTVLPNQVLISRWFRSRLGLANGLISAGTVLGGALSTTVVTRCTEAYGRAPAFLVLAACVGIVPPLVGLLVVRDRPSDMGLEPYDEGEAERDADATRAPSAQPVAVGDVMRDRAFWLLTGGILLSTVPCYTSNKHLILYLRDLGLDAIAAADVKSIFITVAGAGRLLAGLAADRFPRAHVLVATYLAAAIGFPLVFFMPAWPAIAGYVVLFGLAYGAIMPMMPIMAVECFGLGAIGAILGMIKIGYDAGAATAPLVAAWVHDRVGDYALVFAVNAACGWAAVACGIALARMRAAAPQTAFVTVATRKNVVS
ncbi:MAG TPA: MFS transporter [Burkholderiales bacterium]|nr:MFS transporter [Burkholderiales bacterium]